MHPENPKTIFKSTKVKYIPKKGLGIRSIQMPKRMIEMKILIKLIFFNTIYNFRYPVRKKSTAKE